MIRSMRVPEWPQWHQAYRGMLMMPSLGRVLRRATLEVTLRITLGALTVGVLACGGVADESKLPPDVQDPTTLKTPSGALQRYRGALATLPEALDQYTVLSGIWTDELVANPAPPGIGSAYSAIDTRTDLTGASFEQVYAQLHRVRGQAEEARGFLAAYAPDASPALQGHLYTLEGYAEVLLADLFCSGIPLSTVDFDHDYTLKPGSSTQAVYEHALALFDTALTLESDSARLQTLTTIMRGRVLLALGRYAAAAAAVAAVPDGYTYQVRFVPTVSNGTSNRLLDAFLNNNTGYPKIAATPGMADQEGGNGLDYRSSTDPRTPATLEGNDVLGYPYYFPAKYPDANGSPDTLTVASGVEARLIEAEAGLQAGGDWLGKLNALRETVGLADTTDPGTPEARVNLLFRERAFWLYLTGHRQGDLRHLVRDYGRNPNTVYPAGAYSGAGGRYGDAIVVPVPPSEQTLNPQYTGCIDHGA